MYRFHGVVGCGQPVQVGEGHRGNMSEIQGGGAVIGKSEVVQEGLGGTGCLRLVDIWGSEGGGGGGGSEDVIQKTRL